MKEVLTPEQEGSKNETLLHRKHLRLGPFLCTRFTGNIALYGIFLKMIRLLY